jgi:hypothetical protein
MIGVELEKNCHERAHPRLSDYIRVHADDEMIEPAGPTK